MNYFEITDKNLKLHNQPEQVEEMYYMDDCTVDAINTKASSGIVSDSTGSYDVHIDTCTCDIYRSNKLPCRHIYSLAKKLNILKTQTLRSKELLADFSKGYADGWKFVVRPCNYLALDIVWSQEVKNKKVVWKGWKQGTNYHFTAGSVFYDSLVAYNTSWGEALKEITYSIQIDTSTPMQEDIYVDVDENHCMHRYIKHSGGSVTYSVYENDGTREFLSYQATCSQSEFLNILKYGLPQIGKEP